MGNISIERAALLSEFYCLCARLGTLAMLAAMRRLSS